MPELLAEDFQGCQMPFFSGTTTPFTFRGEAMTDMSRDAMRADDKVLRNAK